MVGIAMREFACSLCGQTFEKYSGDLIIPGPEICESCLCEVWEMDDATLTTHVGLCLKKQQGSVTEHSMVQFIQWEKQTWASPEDAIQARKKPFHYLGL